MSDETKKTVLDAVGMAAAWRETASQWPDTAQHVLRKIEDLPAKPSDVIFGLLRVEGDPAVAGILSDFHDLFLKREGE